MIYKTYSDLSNDIKNNINKINYQKFDLIVGVPRSGMIPAYMVSLLLNIHCIALPAFIRNEKVNKGITRGVGFDFINAHEAKNILIIDDSVLSGKSILDALSKIPKCFNGRVTTAAIYSTEIERDDVSIVFIKAETPRTFEWNIYHHPVVNNSCYDIDGVLCYDPTEEQNDDGEKYIDFLVNAKPRFIPTQKINFLVTNRLEKYRTQTENWLSKHGVKYNQLIMLDLATKEARLALDDYYKHKATFYKSCDCTLFVESDINQAIEIANRSNKFVFCVDDNIMISPGRFKRFKNKEYLTSKIRYKLSRVKVFKKIFNFFKYKLLM